MKFGVLKCLAEDLTPDEGMSSWDGSDENEIRFKWLEDKLHSIYSEAVLTDRKMKNEKSFKSARIRVRCGHHGGGGAADDPYTEALFPEAFNIQKKIPYTHVYGSPQQSSLLPMGQTLRLQKAKKQKTKSRQKLLSLSPSGASSGTSRSALQNAWTKWKTKVASNNDTVQGYDMNGNNNSIGNSDGDIDKLDKQHHQQQQHYLSSPSSSSDLKFSRPGDALVLQRGELRLKSSTNRGFTSESDAVWEEVESGNYFTPFVYNLGTLDSLILLPEFRLQEPVYDNEGRAEYYSGDGNNKKEHGKVEMSTELLQSRLRALYVVNGKNINTDIVEDRDFVTDSNSNGNSNSSDGPNRIDSKENKSFIDMSSKLVDFTNYTEVKSQCKATQSKSKNKGRGMRSLSEENKQHDERNNGDDAMINFLSRYVILDGISISQGDIDGKESWTWRQGVKEEHSSKNAISIESTIDAHVKELRSVHDQCNLQIIDLRRKVQSELNAWPEQAKLQDLNRMTTQRWIEKEAQRQDKGVKKRRNI